MSTPVLDRADNGYFYAYWSVGRRSRRKSMGTKDRPLAEARFAEWLLLGGHRTIQTPESAPLTVAELWQAYETDHIETQVVSQRTARTVGKHLMQHFGAMLPADISQTTVDEYGRLRARGQIGRRAGASTCRRELVALRACLNWAASKKRRLLARDDVPEFDLPSDGPPRDRWLTHEEMRRLLAAAREIRKARRHKRLSRVERFLWIAHETGARCGAILDLTWDRVDFERGVIDFRDPTRRATKKRRTAVPISTALLPILKRADAERKGDLVLDHKSGIYRALSGVASRAGVRGVSPNVLRHTAATHMAQAGVPLWKIANILGNSLEMVERVYAKWQLDQARAVVDAISGDALAAAA